jgi:hypothetical protein
VPWKPDYITVVDANAFLRLPDSIDDAQVGTWVTAASRAIDKRCNRQFGTIAPTAAARVYRRPAVYDPVTGMWLLSIDDVQDVTGMTVRGVAYASSGAVLLPDNAPADSVPWTALGFADRPDLSYAGAPASVTVVARWGWTAVPAQVVVAARLQVNRWAARRDSPFGVSGSPTDGSELRLLAKLDPDVAVSLAGLSRPRRVG